MAHEATTYYMAVFGFQDLVNIPMNSHTFAAFIETEGGEPVSVHSISWMPKTLAVKFLGPAETGVNLSLVESIELGVNNGRRVTQWGPYRIEKELFDRAVKQSKRLLSDEVKYKCLDNGHRPHRATNCIHAVCDIDTDSGLLRTRIKRGHRASRAVLRHFGKWILDSEQAAWLNEKLGIHHYPLERG